MDPATVTAAIAIARGLFVAGAEIVKILQSQAVSEEQKDAIRALSEEATAGIKAATPIPKPKPIAGFVA